MKTRRLMQTSKHFVEAGSVVEADSDPGMQTDSCQRAETAGSAGQTAHTLSAQVLKFLAGAPAVHSDCTAAVTANLYRWARLGLTAVLPMVDLRGGIRGLASVSEEGR